VPEDSTGPIFVCTRNDELDAVLQATPPSRREGNYFGHFSIRLLLLCCDHSSFPILSKGVPSGPARANDLPGGHADLDGSHPGLL
jgi:hypothetical protein